MPKVNPPLYSLNGGEVGDEALARLDLERMQFAGSLYSNVLPRVVGSMTLRPGLERMAELPLGDVELLEYDYSQGSDSLPVLSNNELRIFQGDDFISRAAVTTTIADGDFSAFTGWSDTSTGTATATAAGGQLVLTGAPFRRAEASQTIAVADQGIQHGLRLNVARGPVTVAIGSTIGEDDILSARTLSDGDHSLTFTPSVASIVLRIWSDEDRQILVDSCQIDASGDLVLDSPYGTGDFSAIRYTQSIDKVFIASPSYQQRVLTRWSDGGWGLERYKVNNGPFALGDDSISLTPSVLTQNGTLTASLPYFEASMIGRLFRLTQSGQQVITTLDGEDQQSAFIRVTGVGSNRAFNYTISGTFVATWTLEVAVDDGSGSPTGWQVVRTGTAPFTGVYTDTDNNVVKFFRIAIATGDYTSGEVQVNFDYSGGSQDGVCRVTGFTSATEVDMEVLDPFFSLEATSEWDRSEWSDFDGWPGSVTFFGGRLYWERLEQVFGSVSEAFNSFDDTIEGDSAPINRSLNSGGHSGARWLLDLQRLVAGTDVSEVSVRSSAFDEPLTAANWFPLDASTQGSYPIRALKLDKDGVYVTADGLSLHRSFFDQAEQDYRSDDLTKLHQDIFDNSRPVALAVQRKPDTIVWIILEDGTCRALTYEPTERVLAWSRVETDGEFKRVAVVRGQTRDSVYFVVSRNGTQHLERMATLDGCRRSDDNCLADSFVRFDGAASTTFAVPHLDGRQVTVWADGSFVHDQSDLYTVTSGQVVLQNSASRVVIGLPYKGKWRSTKLAYGAALGTALFQPKRVNQLGLYFVKTVLDGVRVGRDENNTFRYKTTKNDAPITAGEFQAEFDGQLTGFAGDWDTDSRIYMEISSPYPCTVAALAMQVKTNDIG